MSLSPARTFAAAVLLTVLVAGCDSGDSSGTGSQPTDSAQSTSPSSGTSASTSTSTSTDPSQSPTPAGVGALPARTILSRAAAAAKAAPSVRMQARLTLDDEPLAMDMNLAANGAYGSFTGAEGPVNLIVLGRTVYMKPSEKFLRKQSSSKAEADGVIDVLGGRWIKLTKLDRDIQALVDLSNKANLFKTMLDQPAGGGLKKTAPRTVAGVRCIGLTDGQGTIWVDAVNARPVRMEAPGSGKQRDLFVFSRYGQVRTPKAPPKSQILDGKQLGL